MALKSENLSKIISITYPLSLFNDKLTINWVISKIFNSFGLFEAMSAIELMDPKMDAGMLSNQSQARIKSLSQAVEVG